LVGLLICFWSSQLCAQSIESLKQDSILNDKVKTNPFNPYNSSRTKWLKKNGFKVEEYNWNDQIVNLELKRAFRKRMGSRIWGVAAFSKVIIFRKGGGFILTLTGLSGLVALSKNVKANQAIKNAEVLRSSFLLSAAIPKYNKPFSLSKTELKDSLQKSDLMLLNRNGFDTRNYQWENEKINLYLNRSIAQNSAKNASNIMGITTMVIGLAGYFANAAAGHRGKGDDFSTSFFVVSSGFFMTSIILNGASLKNLRIAKRLKANNDFSVHTIDEL
jgi:hypothetical protein